MRGRKVTAIGAATAIVVGCVAITPAGGFISPGWAMLLGALAALPSYAIIVWRTRTRVDETLDVLAAHGIAGFFGILFIGFFAELSWNGVSDGLFYGNAAQLGDQALAALAAPVYAFVATFVLLKLIGAVMPLRASEHEEALGHGRRPARRGGLRHRRGRDPRLPRGWRHRSGPGRRSGLVGIGETRVCGLASAGPSGTRTQGGRIAALFGRLRTPYRAASAAAGRARGFRQSLLVARAAPGGQTCAASASAATALPWRIRSAARSATAIVGALVLPRGTVGITEASTTRSASSPSTRSSASTTEPIAQVPTGW